MSITAEEKEQQWSDFLNAWPVDAIKNLTLSEYTTTADDREGDNPSYPFTYWLESETNDLGSIWGGSAFKFGIFRRKKKTPKESDKSRSYSDDYGWYSKLGSSPEEAFQNVKKYILEVIDNAQKGNLEGIDKSPLGDTLSWKVAFLYQNRKQPIIMPIYTARIIRKMHNAFSKQTPLSNYHKKLMSERAGANIFEYAENLFEQFSDEENTEPANKGASQGQSRDSEMTKKSNHPLNQILYGPPGTGKTYTTAKIAVEICDGTAPKERDALMERYNELVESKRIAFTTFHQSMGYEEFIEGLRPVTDSDEDGESNGAGFRLEPKNGIFRDICTLAKEAPVKSGDGSDYDFTGKSFFKMSLGRAKSESFIYEACLEQNCIVLGYGGEVDWSEPKYESYDAVKEKWQSIEPDASGNNGNISQVWTFRGRMKKGDIVVVSDGNLRFRAIGEVVGDYEYSPPGANDGEFISGKDFYSHRRAVKWLKVLDESLPAEVILSTRFSQASCYHIERGKIKLEALSEYVAGDSAPKAKAGAADNYVLIMDEINRANISKVFGELITLIEPDKRLGSGNNALQVTLPYSNDKFGVPNNLHLIGTMNTADRSIALLNTALRRRFSFQEMIPLYHIDGMDRIIDDVHLGKFLSAINKRVEWLFDRDHQIGHSFLMGVKTRADLDKAMRENIIPLLVEYFYEDWKKVIYALNDTGNHFIKEEVLKAPKLLGDAEEARLRYSVNNDDIPLEAYDAASEQ